MRAKDAPNISINRAVSMRQKDGQLIDKPKLLKHNSCFITSKNIVISITLLSIFPQKGEKDCINKKPSHDYLPERLLLVLLKLRLSTF